MKGYYQLVRNIASSSGAELDPTLGKKLGLTLGENLIVREPNAHFRRSVAPPCEKVIFTFKRSYITYTSEVRKSVLDMPVPGSFRNIDHSYEANKA